MIAHERTGKERAYARGVQLCSNYSARVLRYIQPSYRVARCFLLAFFSSHILGSTYCASLSIVRAAIMHSSGMENRRGASRPSNNFVFPPSPFLFLLSYRALVADFRQERRVAG
jgi:hypothetical protein